MGFKINLRGEKTPLEILQQQILGDKKRHFSFLTGLCSISVIVGVVIGCLIMRAIDRMALGITSIANAAYVEMSTNGYSHLGEKFHATVGANEVFIDDGKCEKSLPDEVCDSLPSVPQSLPNDDMQRIIIAYQWKATSKKEIQRRVRIEQVGDNGVSLSWTIESWTEE